MNTPIDMELAGEQGLANAIVIQAAEDYRRALRRLRRDPRHKESLILKDSCERFFRSQWYGVPTDADGEMLMQRIREEVTRRGRRREIMDYLSERSVQRERSTL